MQSTEAQKLEIHLQKLIDDEVPLTRVLSAVERLLVVEPNNLNGLHAKAVCCLMRDKFGAAVKVLEQIQLLQPKIIFTSSSFGFRKAYAHYRLRQYEEAKDVLSSVGKLAGQHTPCRHLKAQVHYNLEEYTEAAQEYLSILKDKAYRDEQERSEIATNLSAAYSACQPTKAVETILNADDKTFDMCYNGATALITSGDMAGAMKMLVQAEVLCAKEYPKSSIRTLEETLLMKEEDVIRKMGVAAATEDRHFFSDVANVWVQMAYVWQVIGEEEKASMALHLVLTLKPTSVVTNAVASTNWAAMKGDGDFFEVSKKLKILLNSNSLDRLTSKQLLSLRYNYALLNFRFGNKATCRRELENLKRDYPDHYLTYAMQLGLMSLEAAKKQKFSDEDLKSLAKKVEAAVKKSGDGDGCTGFLTVSPILAELYLQQGDLHRASNELSADKGVLGRSSSAVTSIASWRVQTGDVKTGFEFLEKEIIQMPPREAVKVIQWVVKDFSTNGGLHAATVELLERLWSQLPWLSQSKQMSALRCFVLSFTDVTAARAAASAFNEGTTVGSSTLRSLSQWQPTRQEMEVLGYRRSTVDEGAEKVRGARHRRQRKMRRPPKVLTENKIDPERWIPMKLRSYIVSLPGRRKRELRRLRAIEQDRLRRTAEKRQQEVRQNDPQKSTSVVQ